MVPIPMLVVNGDICKNVREHSLKQRSISHLTVIFAMSIMGDEYSLRVSKILFLMVMLYVILMYIWNFVLISNMYIYIYIYIYNIYFIYIFQFKFYGSITS